MEATMSAPEIDETRERLMRYVAELELVERTPTSQLTQDERLELHIVLNKGRMVLNAGQPEELVETLRYVRRWRRGFVTRLRQRQAGTLKELRFG